MTILKKIENVLWVILLSSVAFVGVIVLALQNGEIKRNINYKDKTLDSIHNELYLNKIEMNRIELSLEHLKKVNPKAYNQYLEYHDNETE